MIALFPCIMLIAYGISYLIFPLKDSVQSKFLWYDLTKKEGHYIRKIIPKTYILVGLVGLFIAVLTRMLVPTLDEIFFCIAQILIYQCVIFIWIKVKLKKFEKDC